MDALIQGHQHAAPARGRAGGCAHGIEQVQRTIRRQRRRRPHRRGHDDGHVSLQHQVQQHRGFLERVGAVRDDHAVHTLHIDPVTDPRHQTLPHVEGQVLAVDLRDLLSAHVGDAFQAQLAGCQQLVDGHGTGTIAGRGSGIVRRAGNGAAGGENGDSGQRGHRRDKQEIVTRRIVSARRAFAPNEKRRRKGRRPVGKQTRVTSRRRRARSHSRLPRPCATKS